jgi:hypothetical protein
MGVDKRLLREAQELEAEYQRRKGKRRLNDPLEFATSIGKAPDEWQGQVLTFKGKRLILNCARQAGKSTMVAILGLHRALVKPGALILVISPSQRQSSELLIKVKEAMRGMEMAPEVENDNKLSVSFSNDSRIVSLPANEGTIRGFSNVELLIEDEAGDVPDELNAAIRPMLAISGGQLLLLGTPRGRRGHFFESWEHGGDDWTRIKVTADRIPRYEPDFLTREREDMYRRGMGEFYRQEYECEFVNAAAGRVYSGFDDQRNCIDELPKGARSDWTYLCGLDFGIKDANAITVLGWRAHDPCIYVVESYHHEAIPSEMAEEVKRLDAKYQFARIVGDVGGMGKAFAEEARRRYHLPIEPAEKHNKVGFISLFNGDLHTGRIKILRSTCRDLIAEYYELPWAEGGKKEADGFDNHCADSCTYIWRAANAFLETTRTVIDPGSREWRLKQQEDLLARDWEKIERERSEEWWQRIS